MDATKEINKLLSSYAYNSGHDFAQVFDNWLDWMIGWFDTDLIRKRGCDYPSIMDDMKADNETFYECFSLVAKDTAWHIEQKGWYDAFGSLYEDKVKSGYKASSMGQFFTPDSLCDAMAGIVIDSTKTPFLYDPCCGSGRLLLASYGKLDKEKFHYFIAGDLDAISCKMCSLNMMLHGMFGIVERRDALTMEFFSGYVINEMCYPFPVATPTIRRTDEVGCRKNLAFARSIAPKKEDRSDCGVAVKIEAPSKKDEEPRQLSLFNLDEL